MQKDEKDVDMSDEEKKPPKKPEEPIKLPVVRPPTPSTEVSKGSDEEHDNKSGTG